MLWVCTAAHRSRGQAKGQGMCGVVASHRRVLGRGCTPGMHSHSNIHPAQASWRRWRRGRARYPVMMWHGRPCAVHAPCCRTCAGEQCRR